MIKKRVFFAVNLPEKVKNVLAEYRIKNDDLSVFGKPAARWVKKDSLHLTLVFVGYVDDGQILDICRAARRIAAESGFFEVIFKKIDLGPSDKPRMIWAEGESSENLSGLKKRLEDVLSETDVVFSLTGRQSMRPHITLARLNRNNRSLPFVTENVNLRVPVSGFELMESDLRRGGAEYAVLESFVFGGGE